MHDSSYKMMRHLINDYCPEDRSESVVYDIGSLDVNGSYRPLIQELGFKDYIGVDVQEGPNVDHVVGGNSKYWNLVGWSDLTISGQCLEHVERPWEWIDNVVAVTKLHKPIIIIAPWQWAIHRYPKDCWRILPDGMKALMEYAGLTVHDIGIHADDCFGVGSRGDL